MVELPPVVARMWGREHASRRGPRPRLDLATITAAAIEIADTEGLAGVSMGSVAARVGVAPMALYRYVGSKDELLTVMADSAVPPPPERGDLSWRDYLAAWTRANRDFLLSRPWLLSVQGLTPPMGPRRLYWLDRVLDALGDTTLDDAEKFNAATALSGYALTDATLVHTMNAGGERLAAAGVTGATDYGEVLAEVLDPQTYPALSAMMRSGLLRDSEGWTEDADFLFGLNLLLDGIEALMSRRAPRPGD
ncbi:TetR/AcrR family transcriptional regulator [Nonomuraea africana]|uniref:AcrR family transcriptional regulator n=1 Tax=Nonomuraea africana TaxID=46171 RepID=A0ABR9KNB7_9ACTN|nr:TetR/AcrR family transcriptional regulator [Nonomuraea africana]MBE1563525.1 AcrR family transcriptional regulator [Nonomuraea africana]